MRNIFGPEIEPSQDGYRDAVGMFLEHYEIGTGHAEAILDANKVILVLKASDLRDAGITEVELDHLQAICARVAKYRAAAGKPDLECVVVEKDWPEYEPTWQAIEQRVSAIHKDIERGARLSTGRLPI